MPRDHLANERETGDRTRQLRGAASVMAALVLVQAAVGMVVNLYVAIPIDQPGAGPAGVLTSSWRSFDWALNRSPAALASHAGLGLIVALSAIALAVWATILHAKQESAIAWLAVALILGAAVSGLGFLDTAGESSYSLLMALLAFSAIGCYVTIVHATT